VSMSQLLCLSQVQIISIGIPWARVTRRLIPFLFTCSVLNYIDRINVGFAKLHFQDSLGFSDAVFGLGLSLFFVGYLLFEVPSNLLLARFGARKTISRIMVLWGLVSIATMFVTTSTQFYIGRFLLGVAEAVLDPASYSICPTGTIRASARE